VNNAILYAYYVREWHHRHVILYCNNYITIYLIFMMKFKLIAVVFLFLGSNFAFGQSGDTDNRRKAQFGLKAGTNYSNVYNSKTEEFRADPKFGFAGGAFIRFPIAELLGFQPEVIFSQKGFKGEGSILGSQYELTRTTSYLDIPLQLAFKPSEFITLVAGPQYSYLISQKDEFESSSLTFTQQEEFENDNFRKNIFGFVAGVDINLKHVVLGGRFGWDIQDNHGDGTSSTPRYKNAWFQGTIGVTLY